MAITPFIPPSFLGSLPVGLWSGADGLPVLPFLPGQDIAVSKAPVWSTKVVRSASGLERRTAYWSFPLWKFELSHGVIRHRPTQAELYAMWEFFNVMRGQFGPWLFVDPTDCQLPTSLLLDSLGQPLLDSGNNLITDGSSTQQSQTFATGDGSTTVFQLTRDINSFAEPVFAVFRPAIFVAGVLKSSGADYTVSQGKVTFTVAPAHGAVLSWVGWYYFGCRFAQDDLTFEQIVQQLWSGKSLKFTSLRV